MAEIQVVPFVDIVLVLLVVFMVGAPLAVQGIDVQLPETRSSNLGLGAATPLVIMLKNDGSYTLSWSEEIISTRKLPELSRYVQVLLGRNPSAMVVVRADASVHYQAVASLLAEVRAAGVERVGLVTRTASRVEVDAAIP